ncbi:MAG TPA: molybdopterin-dependent oxidoreductase [Puia sp.]|jgi:DMSO/TMAO reductase YedYZ molybdopterin-dependent catalytic subunit|nr:molybdopterin-dependent oxidoreductase [Puia sp.]
MRLLLIACSLLLLARPAGAQTATRGSADSLSVMVTGEVRQPLTLSLSDMSAMPRTTVSARDKQGVPHAYSGVALSDIFQKAGVTTGAQLRGRNMTKYVLVSCADGYQVVFSLAELDSAFTDRIVILADQMEGKPLPSATGPFRIIVPGDKRPARDCFRVRTIAIHSAKD